MSRIGKQPIQVPAGVTVSLSGRSVTVEGPEATLSHTFPYGIGIEQAGNTLTVTRISDKKEHRAFHGMTRAILSNMVKGVKEPFTKIVEIHGTGFGAVVNGNELELDIGFSNKIQIPIPDGLTVKPQKGRPIVVTISGSDKQAVGQLAAVIRSKRPPSPYGSDNKGIRYKGEFIRKKAGKAFGDKK